MPPAGFEHTIPVFKQAKTFHALDRAATVTGVDGYMRLDNIQGRSPFIKSSIDLLKVRSV
jgi:hypothetical protein